MEEVVEGEDPHDKPDLADPAAKVRAPDRVTRRLLVRNTLTTGFGKVVLAVVAIVTTPFLLRRLGPEQYGIWVLATTLTFDTGYLGLADLGLRPAAVRAIAEARGRRDQATVSEIVSTATAFFAILGIGLGVVLALSAHSLATLFHVESELRWAAVQVFLLVGCEIAFDLPAAGFQSLLEGSQRYSLLRTVEVGGRVLWAAGVMAAVALGHGVVALGVVALSVAVLQFFTSILFARRVDPLLRVRPSRAHRETFRALTRTGTSLLVLRVTSVIWSQMDRIIIGVALTASAVARYEVAYKVHAMAALVLSVAPSAVMPASAFMSASSEGKPLRDLYLEGTKYAVALSLPVTIAGQLFAPAIIRAWVGPSYADLAGVTRLFLIYPAIVVVHQIGLSILIGVGRMREMMKLSFFAAIVNLVLSSLLVSRFGITGVVIGTLTGFCVIWVPYTRLFFREFSVSTSEWLRKVALPNLPGLAAQLATAALVMKALGDTTNLFIVGAAVAVSAATNIAFFVFVALRRGERRALFATLRRVKPAAA